MAALKLLERVEELNYIVLECLAERTLADRYQVMLAGGKGFDPRVKEWLSVLLPLALDREVCIITNMGAIDPPGAQKEILDLASSLGLEITVAVAYESSISGPENSVLSNEWEWQREEAHILVQPPLYIAWKLTNHMSSLLLGLLMQHYF